MDNFLGISKIYTKMLEYFKKILEVVETIIPIQK